MCLVLLAWKKHPDLPLVLATNRDELHRRPSAPLRFWQDVPILGGRDLQAGGTWLGMDPEHRVAVVTNWHRSQNLPSARARSRGDLIRSFLARRSPAARYAREVHAARHQYNGFSLLLFDQDEAWYVSSEVDPPQPLQPGLYGLANAGLEADDPRIQQGRTRLARWLEKGEGQARELLDLLADAEPPASASPFILGPDYGTRASSVVLRQRQDGSLFVERRYQADGQAEGETWADWPAEARVPRLREVR